MALVVAMLVAFAFGCASPSSAPPATSAAPAAPSAAAPASAAPDANTPDAPVVKDTIKVGISLSTITEYIADMMEAFTKYAEESTNPKIEILGQFTSNRDTQKVFEHINTFKAQGADAIILNIFDTSVGAEYIAQAAGTPTIFFGRQIDMELCKDPKVCYIGGSEYSAGYMQGEYMSKLCKDKGMSEVNYAILIGDLGSQNARERTRGAKEAMEASGLKVNLVFEDACAWARAEAMSKIEQLLGSGKPLDVIIANSDDMAMGAYEAVNAAGKTDKIMIAGLDGSVNGVTSLKNGELAMTVLQNGRAQAKQALDCAVLTSQNVPLEEYYEIAFEPITPENLSDYTYILER